MMGWQLEKILNSVPEESYSEICLNGIKAFPAIVAHYEKKRVGDTDELFAHFTMVVPVSCKIKKYTALEYLTAWEGVAGQQNETAKYIPEVELTRKVKKELFNTKTKLKKVKDSEQRIRTKLQTFDMKGMKSVNALAAKMRI